MNKPSKTILVFDHVNEALHSKLIEKLKEQGINVVSEKNHTLNSCNTTNTPNLIHDNGFLRLNSQLYQDQFLREKNKLFIKKQGRKNKNF